MRTYSHALLTLAAARRLKPRTSVPALLGATLPDLPVAAGAVWLWTKRGLFNRDQFLRQACAKTSFAVPDAALHSTLPAATALALYAVPGIGRLDHSRFLLAFLLGWAGHVVTDMLTHAEDARPLLWPLSEIRFSSPVSYWERERGARLFTIVEHAAALSAAAHLLGGRHRRHSYVHRRTRR